MRRFIEKYKKIARNFVFVLLTLCDKKKFSNVFEDESYKWQDIQYDCRQSISSHTMITL